MFNSYPLKCIKNYATMSYHYPPIKISKTKNPIVPSTGENTERQKPSFTVDGNAKVRT